MFWSVKGEQSVKGEHSVKGEQSVKGEHSEKGEHLYYRPSILIFRPSVCVCIVI